MHRRGSTYFFHASYLWGPVEIAWLVTDYISSTWNVLYMTRVQREKGCPHSRNTFIFWWSDYSLFGDWWFGSEKSGDLALLGGMYSPSQSDPKMTSTCPRPRYPYASYIHPRAQNFLFVLRLAIFEIWTNFGKSASNDPITAYGHIVRPKGSIYILLTPPRPQFSLVPLYNQAFSNFIWPNFVKCTKWPQNIEHKWNAPDIYEWLLFAC